MKNAHAQPYDRRRQILRILLTHGPLSIRGIESILLQKSGRRALRRSIHRLCTKGYLMKRNERAFGGRGIFYCITPQKEKWTGIARLMGEDESKIYQPTIRHQELLHSEACAVWTERLKQFFPQAKVLREYQLLADPIASRKLLSGANDLELRPDILVLEPHKTKSGFVSVAVEIENSPKSEKRILHKLKKYTNRTLLDGVLYISSEAMISERIRLIYRSKVQERALRIKQYGNNFFLFSKGLLSTNQNELTAFNSSHQSVSLSEWMCHLSQTENLLRRDSQFEHEPSRGPML